MTGFLYIGSSIASIVLYGGNLNQNFIVNITREPNNPNTFTMLVTIIITCLTHVPFIFYAGKQSLLSMLDEIFRGGTSRALNEEYFSEEEKEMALDDENTFRSWNSLLYWFFSLVFYGGCLYGGMVIDDLGPVFELIAALANS